MTKQWHGARMALACALCLGACAPLLAAGPGSPAALLPALDGQDAYWPSAGYGKDIFLVVWQSGRMTTGQIVGCRVRKRDGAVADAQPFLISAAQDDQERPRVSFGGGVFLVVWQDLRNHKDYDVYAARVTPEGKVLDPKGFLVAGGPGNQDTPRLTFDGTNFYVVWEDMRSRRLYEVFGARVSPAGKVLDSGGVKLASDVKSGRHRFLPVAASGGKGTVVVAWCGNIVVGRGARAGVVVVKGGAVRARHVIKLPGEKSPGDRAQPLTLAASPQGYLLSYKNPEGRGGTNQANTLPLGADGTPGKERFFLSGRHYMFDPHTAWDGQGYVGVWHTQQSSKKRAYYYDAVQLAAWKGKQAPAKAQRIAGTFAAPARQAVLATDGQGLSLVAFEQHPASSNVPIKIGVRWFARGGVKAPPLRAPSSPDTAQTPKPSRKLWFLEKSARTTPPAAVYAKDARWKRMGVFSGTYVQGYHDGPRKGVRSKNPLSIQYNFDGGGEFVLRYYDKPTERYMTLAGRARGYLDGPFSRARFGGWGYSRGLRGARSQGGTKQYIIEPYLGGVLRELDFTTWTVRTLYKDTAGVVAMVLDKSGKIWLVGHRGAKVFDPKTKKVSSLKLEMKPRCISHGFTAKLDEEHQRLFGMNRNGPNGHYVWYWDLKAGGKYVGVLPNAKALGQQARPICATGPFEGSYLHCPSGFRLGPADPEGRWAFLGGGDNTTFFRLDMRKKIVDTFGPVNKKERPPYKTLGWVHHNKKFPFGSVTTWSGPPTFDEEGNLYLNHNVWPATLWFKRIQ